MYIYIYINFPINYSSELWRFDLYLYYLYLYSYLYILILFKVSLNKEQYNVDFTNYRKRLSNINI